jgi:flagellar biosynthesis anti-sigma factor FlgM
MKINPITNPNILRTYQATKPVQEKARVTSKRDEVTFSDEALSFSKAMTEAKDTLELRTPEEKARIADIRAAVRQGTYKVDSAKVAEKILESIQGRK